MQEIYNNNKNIFLLLLLFCAILVCIWCYYPGLNGGFYLDDSPNIEENSFLYIDSLSFDELWQATWSGQAGHLKRPIPMLSFALNIYFAENNVYAMKITNLIIHILCALLIIYFLSLLVSTNNKLEQKNFITLSPLAIVVGIAWLLHPFNLTSVLYVVQRMTSLSALFTITACICYVVYRSKQIDSNGHWLKLILYTGITSLLALFSKENAILIPLYLLAIELFIFKFKANSKSDEFVLKTLISLAIILPTVSAIIFLVNNPTWIANWYAHRSFTLEERLLTEARVVVWYARMIIAPDIFNMGLLLDGIELSKSILNPITTLLSVITLVLCSVLILVLRNKAPLVAFGLTWFLFGHLLESTILPLEIAFEHRNYLPSIGLLLAFVQTVQLLIHKLRRLKSLIVVTILLWVALLSFTTHARSDHWKNPANLALVDVEYHPNSVRANVYAGAVFVNLAMGTDDIVEKNEYINKADRYFLNAANLDKVGASSAVGRIIVKSIFDKHIDEEFIKSTITKLESRKLDASSQHALTVLTDCQLAGFCNVPHDLYFSLIDSMINNEKAPKKYRSALLVSKAIYYSDIFNNYSKSRELLNQAITLSSRSLHYRFDLVRIEVMAKRYEKALQELNKIKQNDKLKIYTKNTREWEKLIYDKIKK